MILPYDEAGSGRPLILLHAAVADRSMWADHLGPLSEAGLRVVAPDLPGFGTAPIVPGEQAPWIDVLETMDALGIERAALVGNSFGAAVALRVAVTAPERVAALALVSAPELTGDLSPGLAAAWEAEEQALEDGDLDAAVGVVVDAWVRPGAPDELRRRVAAMQRHAFEVQLAAHELQEGPDPVEDRPDALAHLDVPVLLAVARDDFPDFHAAADALAQRLPDVRRVVIEGAGHLAPLEQATEFRALVLEFLAAAGPPGRTP